jgi:hypothetical protein
MLSIFPVDTGKMVSGKLFLPFFAKDFLYLVLFFCGETFAFWNISQVNLLWMFSSRLPYTGAYLVGTCSSILTLVERRFLPFLLLVRVLSCL